MPRTRGVAATVGHGSPASFVLHAAPGHATGLHRRHPYAETFVIEGGEATFGVGDRTILAGPETLSSLRQKFRTSS
jgi:hypothetical protein